MVESMQICLSILEENKQQLEQNSGNVQKGIPSTVTTNNLGRHFVKHDGTLQTNRELGMA
jgi:hypothetical protein